MELVSWYTVIKARSAGFQSKADEGVICNTPVVQAEEVALGFMTIPNGSNASELHLWPPRPRVCRVRVRRRAFRSGATVVFSFHLVPPPLRRFESNHYRHRFVDSSRPTVVRFRPHERTNGAVAARTDSKNARGMLTQHLLKSKLHTIWPDSVVSSTSGPISLGILN